jgi:heme/copper-type cytochrome/quinol oxidase subunit 2
VRRAFVIAIIVIILAAGVVTVSALYVLSGNRTTTSASHLPAGCAKPPDGFLIIASHLGYNGSVTRDAGPNNPWPIINTTVGSTVHIVVCNTDFQPHGFQVSHYYDSSLVTIEPGQVLNVSFVADQSGTFRIYCNIFCTIHIFMQNGELRVSA